MQATKVMIRLCGYAGTCYRRLVWVSVRPYIADRFWCQFVNPDSLLCVRARARARACVCVCVCGHARACLCLCVGEGVISLFEIFFSYFSKKMFDISCNRSPKDKFA